MNYMGCRDALVARLFLVPGDDFVETCLWHVSLLVGCGGGFVLHLFSLIMAII